MDDQQRQRIDGVAREFTDALVAAYRTTSDGKAAAQQIGAQQVEYFFNTVMNNLRAQSEGTLQITQQLAAQQELAREATQELTRASTDNYMDFLDSVFSFYHGGTSRTQRRAEETQGQVEKAEARAVEAETRAEEAERGRSEAERQTAEAEKGTAKAEARAQEAEKSARAAKGRAQKAERSAREAESRAEDAEGRTLEAQRRAEEAEKLKSKAESQGGDPEGEDEANSDAVHRPQSKWVRTSGRPRVRGRNTTFQRRSSRRR
jgi:chromosome segregation ATPase